jgi:hypothetical protein
MIPLNYIALSLLSINVDYSAMKLHPNIGQKVIIYNIQMDEIRLRLNIT